MEFKFATGSCTQVHWKKCASLICMKIVMRLTSRNTTFPVWRPLHFAWLCSRAASIDFRPTPPSEERHPRRATCDSATFPSQASSCQNHRMCRSFFLRPTKSITLVKRQIFTSTRVSHQLASYKYNFAPFLLLKQI